MRRFFIETSAEEGKTILLEGSEARHISRVLRLGTGETILLFDKDGREYEAIIQSVGKRGVEVVITHRIRQEEQICGPDIVVAQAVLKSDKMDLVIQKCTELGVSRIVPFFSSRTIPRWSEETVGKKHRHWSNIAVASVKQSGAPTVPVVDRPMHLEELICCRDFDGFLKILFWEKENMRNLKMVLKKATDYCGIVAVIGPEGGFSDTEVEQARCYGFTPVRLGPHILRAETVAIAFLAMLHYELASCS